MPVVIVVSVASADLKVLVAIIVRADLVVISVLSVIVVISVFVVLNVLNARDANDVLSVPAGPVVLVDRIALIVDSGASAYMVARQDLTREG